MSALGTIKAAAQATPTSTIVEALRLMGDGQMSGDENLVRAALRDLLEDRHPEVLPAMDSWALLEWGAELGYTAALLASLERAVAAA